jgi:hypothetical protein
MPRTDRKPGFDLHRFLTKIKVLAIEIATTVVFLIWLYRAFLHEIGVR